MEHVPEILRSPRHRLAKFHKEEEAFKWLSKPPFHFLGHLELAQDGGLDEVKDLWHPGRIVAALITIFVVSLNVWKVLSDDMRWIRVERLNAQTDTLNLTEQLLQWTLDRLGVYANHSYSAEFMVAVFELCGLVVLTLSILQSLFDAWLFRKRPYVRWISTSRLFREVVPELKYFSAMRLLQHVQPYVLTRDIKHHMAKAKMRLRQRDGKLWVVVDLILWFFSRFLIFVFGFDAFLVKFRLVAPLAVRGTGNWTEFLKILLFLNQMLGVAQLERFTMRRLIHFVFGGEDNEISEHEELCMKAWLAKLYETIWTVYSPIKAFSVSVTFNDTDFQRLMLNESVFDNRRRTSAILFCRSHTEPLLEGAAGEAQFVPLRSNFAQDDSVLHLSPKGRKSVSSPSSTSATSGRAAQGPSPQAAQGADLRRLPQRSQLLVPPKAAPQRVALPVGGGPGLVAQRASAVVPVDAMPAAALPAAGLPVFQVTRRTGVPPP